MRLNSRKSVERAYPCTPAWTKNAPAANPEKLVGNSQSGNIAQQNKQNMIIVRRLPRYCETYPPMAQPAIAPQLPIMVVTVDAYCERPLSE